MVRNSTETIRLSCVSRANQMSSIRCTASAAVWAYERRDGSQGKAVSGRIQDHLKDRKRSKLGPFIIDRSWEETLTSVRVGKPLPGAQAPNESLRLGVKEALEERVLQQTQEDGLKWNLLKQILKVYGVGRLTSLKVTNVSAAEVYVSVGEATLTRCLYN